MYRFFILSFFSSCTGATFLHFRRKRFPALWKVHPDPVRWMWFPVLWKVHPDPFRWMWFPALQVVHPFTVCGCGFHKKESCTGATHIFIKICFFMCAFCIGCCPLPAFMLLFSLKSLKFPAYLLLFSFFGYFPRVNRFFEISRFYMLCFQ